MILKNVTIQFDDDKGLDEKSILILFTLLQVTSELTLVSKQKSLESNGRLVCVLQDQFQVCNKICAP